MSDFDMILAALIELGHKAGQLTDTEVLQALDCLEAVSYTHLPEMGLCHAKNLPSKISS